MSGTTGFCRDSAELPGSPPAVHVAPVVQWCDRTGFAISTPLRLLSFSLSCAVIMWIFRS